MQRNSNNRPGMASSLVGPVIAVAVIIVVALAVGISHYSKSSASPTPTPAATAAAVPNAEARPTLIPVQSGGLKLIPSPDGFHEVPTSTLVLQVKSWCPKC